MAGEWQKQYHGLRGSGEAGCPVYWGVECKGGCEDNIQDVCRSFEKRWSSVVSTRRNINI